MDDNYIVLKAQESGDRIDALLANMLDDLSRSAAQRLLEAGLVRVCGAVVKKNYTVGVGDVIELTLPEPDAVRLTAQELPLDIVYEDGDLIAVNKARGMVVHPAPGHPDGTLVNALLFHCGDSLSGIGGERRPGIVHRIDKDTSGLIIAAKNDAAHRSLSLQLAEHSMYREYEALVCGGFKDDSGVIDRPIGRHPVDRKRMSVSAKVSRSAVTHWLLIARYRGYTHIACRLETGRTHQIRVHMASIGHPLLGDGLYGAPCPDKGLDGQCLHARRLTFTHPSTGRRIVLECPLPEYFTHVIDRLGPIL